MLRRRMLVFALFCLIAITSSTIAKPPARSDSWNTLVDEFIDQAVFAASPSLATQAGVHEFDTKLEDYSGSAIANQVALLQKFEKRTLAIDSKSLLPMESADPDSWSSRSSALLPKILTLIPAAQRAASSSS
jgi:hypothetical protein